MAVRGVRGAREGDPAPLRRDARRNRDALVAAARDVFAAYGLDASLDEIARRAGVGNATLYRHFPTRGALVDAAFHDVLAETRRLGDEARSHDDAWQALTGYLEQVFAGLAADRGANDLMTTGIEGVVSLEELHAHNRETIGLLIGRAQAQGTLRADVTTEDLLLLLAALGRTVPALTAIVPDAWRRYLAVLLDGLRARPADAPDGGRSLPRPSLTSGQLGEVLRELGPHTAPTSR
ncbi:TetR/AcrR family transcriptional regulator [Streptomyces sp. NPDC091292]|uniref:TetR/AcrR family transcriptional regulator n=1 Tax=Streptomyces sp. NPDC091292 TaxID=3365991 RepID=UPI0038203C51